MLLLLLLISVAHQCCLGLAINPLCTLPLALVLKLFALLDNFSKLPCSPVRHTWTPKEGGPMFGRAWADETPLSSCFGGCSCCASQGACDRNGVLGARESPWRRGWEIMQWKLSVIWCEMPIGCISLEQADWEPPFVKPWKKAQHWFACLVFPRRFLDRVMLFQSPSARAL